MLTSCQLLFKCSSQLAKSFCEDTTIPNHLKSNASIFTMLSLSVKSQDMLSDCVFRVQVSNRSDGKEYCPGCSNNYNPKEIVNYCNKKPSSTAVRSLPSSILNKDYSEHFLRGGCDRDAVESMKALFGSLLDLGINFKT
jgi:hypothetical protein